jgi:hypothetical protein
MYRPHPSAELNALFRRRPFQGAEPERARFVFIGLDANYDAGLEDSPSYKAVLEYHSDGARFWRHHGVHHPFLLPEFRGDGRRYHLNFARIGFTAADAEQVSFIELLHVPTVGRNALEPSDLDRQHLARIDALVGGGLTRHVFVSAGVVRLMLASERFPWLKATARSSEPLPVLYSHGGTRVYKHLHFSNYGKFQRQLDLEAQAIARLLRGSD